MIHPILIHPAPILRDKSAPVPEINDRVRTLLDDMLETMYDAEGRGLAAVQIGVLQRLVVIDTDWKEGARNPLFFVNPEIVWSSTTTEAREERCLSIPNTPKEVIRRGRRRGRSECRRPKTAEMLFQSAFRSFTTGSPKSTLVGRRADRSR
jgi:peptide deformylase